MAFPNNSGPTWGSRLPSASEEKELPHVPRDFNGCQSIHSQNTPHRRDIPCMQVIPTDTSAAFPSLQITFVGAIRSNTFKKKIMSRLVSSLNPTE
jgi:hypothetical protein